MRKVVGRIWKRGGRRENIKKDGDKQSGDGGKGIAVKLTFFRSALL